MKKDSTLPDMVKIIAAVRENAGRIVIASQTAGNTPAGQWEYPGGNIASRGGA